MELIKRYADHVRDVNVWHLAESRIVYDLIPSSNYVKTFCGYRWDTPVYYSGFNLGIEFPLNPIHKFCWPCFHNSLKGLALKALLQSQYKKERKNHVPIFWPDEPTG